MSNGIYLELKVFLIFWLHGAGLLFCSDLLRSWRMMVPHGVWWISLEDAFFWFAAGIWTFILIFIYQDGILRLYMAVAMGTGMYTYRKTFSPWVMKSCCKIWEILCQIGRRLKNVFYRISRFFQKIDIIRQKTIAKSVERE